MSSKVHDMTTALSLDQKRAMLAKKLKEELGELPLHRRFEIQAAKTPEAIAVSCGESHLTYRELNARAGRLAYRLRDEGVGPESLVGLCAERSIELIVGLLAILKAGGAYVPLDPAYPADRLGFQPDDCGAEVLLIDPHLRDRLPAHAARAIDLDPTTAGISTRQLERIDGGTKSDNLAYVIYTSG